MTREAMPIAQIRVDVYATAHVPPHRELFTVPIADDRDVGVSIDEDCEALLVRCSAGRALRINLRQIVREVFRDNATHRALLSPTPDP